MKPAVTATRAALGAAVVTTGLVGAFAGIALLVSAFGGVVLPVVVVVAFLAGVWIAVYLDAREEQRAAVDRIESYGGTD